MKVKDTRHKTMYDLALVVGVAMLAFVLVRSSDWSGLMENSSVLHTLAHVEGLPFAALTTTAALGVVAWRRSQDARDSSARQKRAEQRLAASLQRYQSLFEDNPNPVFFLDLDGAFTDTNRATERVVGYSAAELRGSSFVPLIAGEDLATASDAFEKAVRGEPASHELTVMCKDGHPVELRVHSSPMIVDGNVVGVFGTAEDITEQNQLDQHVRRISRAIDAAADGISIANSDGRMVFVNAARAKMHGFESPEAMLRHGWEDYYAPEDRDRLAEEASPAVAEHGSWRGEVVAQRRDGSTFPCDLSLNLIEDGGIVSVTRDITVEKQAEERLRAGEERYRTILAEISEGYFEVDLRGCFTYLNDSLCRFLGHPREELLGTNNRNYSDPESSAIVYQHFNRVFRTGEPDPGFEWSFRRADGTRAYASTSVTLIRDQTGEPVGFRGVVRDDTARKEAEQALQDSEERYRLVTRATREVIWDADLRGAKVSYQGAVEEVFGCDAEELEREAGWVDSRVHPEDKERVHSSIAALFASAGEVWSDEFRFRAQGGEYVSVFARGYLVRDEAGQPARFMGSMMDISKRKLREEQLRAARHEAEVANQAKSMFLANMSHEIRTPMNGVIGMTDVLLETELDSEQREYAETVRRSGEYLLGIINDILDLSKIEAGKMATASVEFDVRTLVNNAIAAIELSAVDKGLALTAAVSPTVPEMLTGDATRIRQLLTNLLGNAVKFTEEGRVALGVDVSDQSADMVELHFSVEDSGIGLTREQQGRLFQSFSQADATTTRKYGGTGLGLAICKQLVELMGGAIGVESQAGVGSRFWFSLPLGRTVTTTERPEGEGPEGQRPGPSAAAGDWGTARLLLVEDSGVNQKVATAMLKKLGFRVDVADDGLEALESFPRGQYAAVLMDVQMPNMNGYDTAAGIRALEEAADGDVRHRTPIIAMTANALEGDRQKAFEAGMDDYIAKPYRSRELAAVLNRWVPRPGSREAGAGDDEPPDVEPAGAVLDAELVARLRELGQSEGFFPQLVSTFSDSARQETAALREALDADDVNRIASIAHKLKGSSASMGARRVSETCARLERRTQTWDRDAAHALVETLEAELAAAHTALGEEVRRTPPDAEQRR